MNPVAITHVHKNITFDVFTHGGGKKYFNDLINHAIVFLNGYILLDKIIAKILFTDNYSTSVTSIINTNLFIVERTKDPNGSFIPRHCQNGCKDKVDIIVINCKKFLNKYPNWDVNKREVQIAAEIESVIVHELIHCFDYFSMSEFCLKYSIPFNNNVVESNREAALKAYFYYRSEMRAKYYQETYYLEALKAVKLNNYIENGIDKILNTIPKEANAQELEDKQCYDIAHAWGQLLCWKKHNKLGIDKGEAYLNSIDNRKSKYLPEIFEMDVFYKLCNRFCSTAFWEC